ncbi:acryloyl-CoA reductase [Actinomarinicola tropica]|uniref:Acryloyl-CoA reductase n=2 Tax=Actinomarinicola tropica TaxID=2789776 RepID=A0A5Q2RNS9_9ACTN|nr:acryloyl-CoA reductase [Actinomarinicola tropica]
MLDRTDDHVEATIRELDDVDLPAGEVTIDVEWSTVNYKDGLAYAGRPGVVDRYPIVPGVDLAGTVHSSDDPRYGPGDRVTVNGCRMGERHWGGHAERARVPADWVVRLPDAIDTRTAMAIGTAGLTSMLCVLALERHGLTPDDGTVVVTGSSGGVGSVAISLLARRGFRVAAVTGRTEEEPYLRRIGAVEVVDRAELAGPGRPLASERWAGGVDAVGSHTLANVLSATAYGGVVAACGLAQGMDLPASVAPFILRGVTLVGVESVVTPHDRRVAAWDRLATDIDRDLLETMVTEVGLGELPDVTARILEGKVRGRVVVDVRR